MEGRKERSLLVVVRSYSMAPAILPVSDILVTICELDGASAVDAAVAPLALVPGSRRGIGSGKKQMRLPHPGAVVSTHHQEDCRTVGYECGDSLTCSHSGRCWFPHRGFGHCPRCQRSAFRRYTRTLLARGASLEEQPKPRRNQLHGEALQGMDGDHGAKEVGRLSAIRGDLMRSAVPVPLCHSPS